MKRYVTIICNPKKVWSRNYIAWSWATVQMARAAHRKQLLTGSVIAVKGVSRWSLDEHISFRGESEKVRTEERTAVTGKTDPFSAKSCWLSEHRLQKPQDSA
jgi:hypothetical protein